MIKFYPGALSTSSLNEARKPGLSLRGEGVKR